ncbi:sulfite exporter TauE/SafE family protein [uncultured Castellaniella sp.]|uniref:sulfite exporter TauE/SafE family protein n=1 Tax=uncultured Castellaniella sp. TaxID=647907 RepID=UPI002639D6A2|nr:sulfite exporter TauE/SafE family protein [uncultured Castellaniella sp.]
MALELIAILVILGLCTGFAAGLLGIGGGMIMVPLLTAIFSSQGFVSDHVVHMAIATSLSVIFFTSMSSVYAHHKRGAILWPVALLLIPGVIIGSWIGPVIAASLNTRYLAALFGVFVIFSAIKMLKKKAPRADEADNTLPKAPGMTAAGLVIGVLSGLVGAGGGFITVPFLGWRGVSIHNAVATSAVMGFPIALFGTVSYIHQGWDVQGLPAGSLGFIYVPALLSLAVASVLSAPFGARTAHTMNVKQLRSTFAYLLLLLALYMFWKAASA